MDELSNITWLGHASFFLTDKASGNKIYYIDPFDLRQQSLEKGDIIFITHAHQDHCSPDDVQKLLKPDSVVVAPIDCLESLGIPEPNHSPVSPNQSYTVKGVSFLTIAAYNVHKNRLHAHPKANNWVGYILTIDGKKIYHAGDTDFTPEMKTLKDMHLDVAMLPMGGTFTMDVTEMAEAANYIAAKVTVPMHYKRLLGNTYKEAEATLQRLVTNSKVVILDELS